MRSKSTPSTGSNKYISECVENDESLLVQGRNQVDRTEANGAVILNNETKVKMANLLNETFCNLTVTTEGEGTTCTTSIINFVVDQSTGDLFVDFVIIIKRSYMIEALKAANNDLAYPTAYRSLFWVSRMYFFSSSWL